MVARSPINPYRLLPLIILRGLGQIMLQGNAATGLLFLAGISIGSPSMGLAALLAVCCGTGTALLLRFDKAEVAQGLYGFSAALVGVALVLFRGTAPVLWAAVAAGGALAALLQALFIRRKVPVFTLPFVLVTWLLLFLLPVPPEAASLPSPIMPGGTLAAAVVHGFGQVIFQSNTASGLLFIVAVAAHSRISALYGMAAAVFAGLLALGLGRPEGDVELGLWSFNAVLCGIAVAGRKPRNILLFLSTVPVAVLLGMAMEKLPLPQLTFPFVAATCSMLLFEQLVFKRADRRPIGA